MRSPLHRGGGRAGFTLIELVSTLGFILLLLSIVTLNGSTFLAHHRLRNAARQVVTDLRLVRAKAVAQNARYQVLFTGGSSSYAIERLDTVSGNWEPHALRSKSVTTAGAAPLELEAPVRVENSVTVLFEARGSSDGGTVSLSDPGLPGVLPVTVTFAGQVSAD